MNATRFLPIGLAASLLVVALAPAMVDAQQRPGGKGKPVVDFRAPMPKEVTAGRMPKNRSAAFPGTVDITAGTPTVTDTQPYWYFNKDQRDEGRVFFTSNRSDLQGKTVGSVTHIFSTLPNGTGIRAETGPLSTGAIGGTRSQSMPTVNENGNFLTYVERDAGGGVDLVELDIVNRTTKSLIKSQAAINFVDLADPAYAGISGGNLALFFAGKTVSGGPFKLYSVNISTGAIIQLTTGPADDRHPAFNSQVGKNCIAFDSNRANAAGTATKATRDIWVTGTDPNPSVQRFTRVTNFLGDTSNNTHPTWSIQFPSTPGPSDPVQFPSNRQLLGFASTRLDPANDGNATQINPNGTSDVYFLRVNVGPNPLSPSTNTVLNPEGGLNAAIKIATGDPTHTYDDLYPNFPAFVNNYRAVYQTNRTGYDAASGVSSPTPSSPSTPNDIFASSVFDINAPTLCRFDEAVGEVLRVTPRLASPRQSVTIEAKVAELESDIAAVYVQIKNPNSKYQWAGNAEHKVYLTAGLPISGTARVLGVPLEWEMQRVDARDSATYQDPRFVASQDDYYAFTGATALNNPDPGWLQLNRVPNSRDPKTGAWTYRATWTTGDIPTDYVLDLIVIDTAVNPFGAGGGAGAANNWKIYDNVWGFTTAPFVPRSNILFVSDYAHGQKFFNSRFGTAALVNVSHTFWGAESWLTDIDISLLPNSYVDGTTFGAMIDVRNALGVLSYYDGQADDGTTRDGAPHLPGQKYDIWRIICRGAVPAQVLSQYTPTRENQPADTVAGETNQRTVTVADRCVLWHAPYAGNVFTGPGSLTDIATQSQLTSFVQAGGRLFVNGQDVAWALTLDGSASSAFLTNVLRAQYVRDDAGFTFFRIGAGPFQAGYGISGAYALTGSGEPNPITHDPWLQAGGYVPRSSHVYHGPPFPPGTIDYISRDTNYFVAGSDQNTPRAWGSPGAAYPDVITPLGNGTQTDLAYGGGAGSASIHYEDASSGARVAYVAMGLEGLFPDYFAPPNTTNIQRSKNRVAEYLHNVTCWMRTGSVTGAVLDVDGGAPLGGVLVRLARRLSGNTPIADYTAVSAADGTFQMNGVVPLDYEISAYKPGFIIQKRTLVVTHGGFRDNISFRMTKAEPANIKGKVTRTDGTTPVSGATITAVNNLDNTLPPITTTSDINGNYTLERVLASSTYTITCSAAGFGASVPVSYPAPNPNDPIAGQRDTVIQPAKIYTGFDFQLRPEQGSVTGTVTAVSGGAPIVGATVTATFGSQTVTAVTDSNGNFSFNKTNSPANGLDPGTWGFTASAPGFAVNNPAVSATVVSNQNTSGVSIQLVALAPGSVSGLVTQSSNGQPLTGAVIQLLDAQNAVVRTATTTAVQTSVSDPSYRYNFLINNVPAGVTYRVIASKPGYTPIPASLNGPVTSNIETKNLNFTMEPLHTFRGELSLISAPYDYNPTDVADLLGIPSGDRTNRSFNFSTWTGGQYSFWPAPAAATMRLGTGYFMAYTPGGVPTNTSLATLGTSADQNRPFDIPLNPGWNVIGNPFDFEVDWSKLKVLYPGDPTPKTHDQAVADGAINSVLYTYASGSYVIDYRLAPWSGYWVKANRNVVLRIDPIADRIGRAARIPVGRSVLGGSDGWAVMLRVQAGRNADEATMFGVSSRAADGPDSFKSEKPPVVDSTYVRAGFENTGWGSASGRYGVDIRSNTGSKKTWTLVVDTNVRNSPVTISWPNAASAGRKAAITLTDTVTGATVDLRSSSSYTWQAGDQPSSRKFTVEMQTATAQSLQVNGLVARQAGRGGAVSLQYNLTQSAQVEVRILSARGQSLRTLSNGRSRSAGVQEESWDQRDERGVALPSGQYLVEVKAVSTSGQQARAVTQVITVR